MAIDFETIKKIDANGTNVGMIKDSAGNILWRKKYDKLHIGLAEPYDVDVWNWKSVKEYAPNNVMTGTNVAENNYFRYNDRVDIFELINPNVNLNAKLVVSWPSDGAYSQLKDISLLEYRMTTYTASSAVNFNYPVHAKGIARELGRIENQDSWYTDASDTIACVSSDITKEHPESTWAGVLAGATNMARIQNKFPIFESASTSRPASSRSYVTCTTTANDDGSYSCEFYLHIANNDWQFVSFFVVDNSKPLGSGNPQLITLSPDNKEWRITSVTGLNWSILQVGTYVSSSGSFINGSNFMGIWGTGIKYMTLTSSADGYYFDLSSSGEIYNANAKVTSSFSYCNILFKRPSTKYTGLRITYSQDSERNFDFGVFSNLDHQLCPFNVLDSTTTSNNGATIKKTYTGYGSEVVKHSCKGESGTKTITYNISKLDTTLQHSICVKYIKDSSGNTGTDTFKITKIEFVEDVEYNFHYNTAEGYYTLTVNNHGSADAPFEWLYIYIDGSSEDYTLADVPPNELRRTIPAGGSYDFWLHSDPMSEQDGRIFCIFKCNGQYHAIYQ